MAKSQPPAGQPLSGDDGMMSFSERLLQGLAAKLTGEDVAPEDKQSADLKEKCRAANPFPLIAWLLPELVVTDPAEAPFFEGEIGNPDNPCLRMDHWQRRIIASAFDDTISEIAIKGNTKAGKGMSVALSVMLWFYVFDQCKIIVTSQRYEHAVDVMLGEIAMWISRVVHPFPGKVLAQGISANKQRYLTVANPQSGEGFSGQHGPRTLFVFDEATSIPESFYDDAQKQARKIIAPANPRALAGWFRNMYKPCDDPNRTQIVNGPFGRRLCVTVDGADNMNVRHRRLEKPLGPPGGIEISGRRFEHNDTIPPEFHAQVKLLIPNQCDYGRFMGICQHPDPRHVDVFAHGKFPTEDPEKQVILGSWLEFHQLAWDAAGRGELLPVECFGLDTALSTDGDATVLAAGGSKGCRATHKWNFADNTKHVEEVLRITRDVYGVDLKLRQHPVCVDYGGGYGAGVGDILAAMGVWVIPFRPGTPSVVDKSRYGNLRAEGWGTLGRRLDPNDQWGGQAWALPRDSELEAELTAPEKIYGGEGFRFLITPKTSEKVGVISLKERLGRSPDTADAVVCLFHAVRELFSLNQWFMANSGPLTVWPQPEADDAAGSPPPPPPETDLLKFLEDRYGSGGRGGAGAGADDDDDDDGWTLNRWRGVW